MYFNRIIPCLLIDDEDLVKTRKFSNPIYLGDPINTAKIFNDKEVDELILLDIGCSKHEREINYELIEEIVSECFMPICYGGGINHISHADKLFRLGIEKVSINSHNFETLALIEEISKKYGSQSVLMSIDIKSNFWGKKKIFKSTNNSFVEQEISDFIQKGIISGAGEIMITSVDQEGEMKGMDYEIIQTISSQFNVPLVFNGGVGSIDHIIEGLKRGADAIAIGSFFVFKSETRGVLISYIDNKQKAHIQHEISKM